MKRKKKSVISIKWRKFIVGRFTYMALLLAVCINVSSWLGIPEHLGLMAAVLGAGGCLIIDILSIIDELIYTPLPKDEVVDQNDSPEVD